MDKLKYVYGRIVALLDAAGVDIRYHHTGYGGGHLYLVETATGKTLPWDWKDTGEGEEDVPITKGEN
ncbi:hypothetical protein PMI08_04225 [Brevibacillus sp. CF112]|uniref:hypothetical protein n=1 Tax=Brevibacillus TaxID=55080 RepID=UPI000271D53A|nr:hypothetical protein [Brevibacillus sp. CF112]EJL40758.1 hypothetical protein PMI08_04225 [Brevibacillus sp. CF112]